MQRDLTGITVSDQLDEFFDIEDNEKRPGQDMQIVEPKSPSAIKDEGIELKKEDVIHDYAISRSSLHQTLEQLQQVMKAAAEVIQQDPNSKNIGVFPELTRAMNNTVDNLFDIHIKIDKQIKGKEEGKKDDKTEEELVSTNDFLDSLDKEDNSNG